MTIKRGTFTFTFLFDTNVDEEKWVRELTIEQILGNCDSEHMLGGLVGQLEIVDVPNADVPAAEIALGGDGTFFADADALAHFQMDSVEPDYCEVCENILDASDPVGTKCASCAENS